MASSLDRRQPKQPKQELDLSELPGSEDNGEKVEDVTSAILGTSRVVGSEQSPNPEKVAESVMELGIEHGEIV
ncbi:hypothetical protein BUALT_Bualt08G0042400 [Buddleja alternifolia]|uniref:Uncharacterized protein n=1 Tax=Buddleja alternifolia TaxID=168488 RepID=A0AAV6X571_9LAMI|nr:hypothetical protein BUALT_Bualt08G0042400 [Buddleja alternifolia]